MTYKQWEEALLKCLKSLTNEEKDEIIGYFREMYSDKLDTGMTEEEILKSFGDPMIAAARIIKENGEETSTEEELGHEKKDDTSGKSALDNIKAKCSPVLKDAKDKATKAVKSISISKIVGWFFLTLLVIIPLAATLIGVIASVAAVTLSGGALMIAGIATAVASPIILLFEYPISAMLVLLGLGLLSFGIGAFIYVVFYYITKYITVSCVKITKHVVRRSK